VFVLFPSSKFALPKDKRDKNGELKSVAILSLALSPLIPNLLNSLYLNPVSDPVTP